TCYRDWSSDVCSSDLKRAIAGCREPELVLDRGQPDGEGLRYSQARQPGREVRSVAAGPVDGVVVGDEIDVRSRGQIDQHVAHEQIGRASCRGRGEASG